MSVVHPLAARYGNAPWVLHEADGPNGETWVCHAHPDVAPFGPNTFVDWYSIPTSTVTIANSCVECVAAVDPEIAWRRRWWLENYAD